MQIIDGKKISQEIKDEVKEELIRAELEEIPKREKILRLLLFR